MSFAKIHAITAWVNFRLELLGKNKMHNVLIDLFQDLHWQHLIENFTGSPFDKIGTFTGISQIQKSSRMEWILQELISWHLIKEDTKLNPKLIAARSSDETFSLLLKLIYQDIQFLWQRMAFLQLDDNKQISQYPFKITPEKAEAPKPKKFKVKKDLMAGFGASAETYTEIIDENEPPVVKKRIFEYESEMLAQKRSISASNQSIPKPISCLISIIRNHLKMSKNGKNIKITKLTEMCDIRVLCVFFNALIPHTFSSEILPNDRWSINLILKTFEKILKIESEFEATDLNSNDEGALMAYFTTLFLSMYKFRQCMKVLEYKKDLEYKIRYLTLSQEMVSGENNLSSVQNDKTTSQIKEAIIELDELKEKFDIKFCESWKIHQQKNICEATEILKQKINYLFEIMQVPKSITIADLCNKYLICTKTASCSGYYQLKSTETVNDDRKIILRDLNNEKIIIDTVGKSKSKVRFALKVHQVGPVDLVPEKIIRYEIYLDSYSKNKTLSQDDNFLYRLFPSTKYYWNNLLLRASSNNDITTIKILANLFSDDKTFVLWQEPETGNNALHVAVINGHYDAVICLLENGSEVDSKNRFRQTPLFKATDIDNEKICGILLEWGANINLTNNRNHTVLDDCKNNALKLYIENKFKFYSEISASVVSGNSLLFEQAIHDHRTKAQPVFIDLRSRCLQGSTAIHTAAHFSKNIIIKELLMLRVDVNQRDYKGASALHRAKDLEIINLLIEAGADVNLLDDEHNQPLHAACYGDEDEENQIDKINVLINEGADLVTKNNQMLMPIHCAAMQGRCDVIELLLNFDQLKQIEEVLESEKLNPLPPSMNFLAISGGFLACAQWLLDHGFNFKENEANQLLKNIITGELVLHGNSLNQALSLLLYKTGADINKRYPPLSQTALHLAAYLPDATDLLTLLLEAGADVDSTDNEHCTPLFISCKRNDIQSARVFINHNANINVKNNMGHTAFDYVPDYSEWINCGLFDDQTVARLKAYNLKSTRNTIRLIDKKINSTVQRDNSFQLRQLESRLDQNLLEDKIERAKSHCSLRPRSVVH